MAHIIEDRVLEQSTTAGLGAFTLAGAALGFRAFASVCSVADTVPYYIEAIDSLGKPSGAYEYGLGTYSSANVLTRTTVRGSSNGGAAVNFAAGTKLVGIGIAAPSSAAAKAEWIASLGLGSNLPLWQLGNQTAVAGGAMRIDVLIETAAPTFPLEDEGGIWSGKVHTFAGISKEYTASEGEANAAQPAFFVFANSNNCPGDVVAILGDAVARTSGDSVFGGNFIARNASGTTNTKLVGLEIDVEPFIGTSLASDSGGMYINIFTLACPGAAIQVGGVAGGTFGNGIALTGGMASNAAGLFSNGITMGSLVNSGTSTYTEAAVVLSNTHRILLKGTASAHAQIYNDSSNFLHVVSPTTGIAFQNNSDTDTNVFIAESGLVTLGASSTINWNAAQTGTTVGAAGPASALPATPQGYISIQVAGVARRVPFYA